MVQGISIQWPKLRIDCYGFRGHTVGGPMKKVKKDVASRQKTNYDSGQDQGHL
jgi:hypothetical protein